MDLNYYVLAAKSQTLYYYFYLLPVVRPAASGTLVTSETQFYLNWIIFNIKNCSLNIQIKINFVPIQLLDPLAETRTVNSINSP